MNRFVSSPLLRPGLCLLALTLVLACGELARQLPGVRIVNFGHLGDDAQRATNSFKTDSKARSKRARLGAKALFIPAFQR